MSSIKSWINKYDYKNTSDDFILTKNDIKGAYSRQYYEVYEARIEALRERILENADFVLGKGKYNLISLSDKNNDKKGLVIGVIVKRSAQRPSILKTILNDDKVAYEDYDEDDNEYQRNLRKDDFIEFEADKQVVRLVGSIDIDMCATGVCAGVFGQLGSAGVFNVDHVVWPKLGIPPELKADRKGMVAFISGIELSGDLDKDCVKVATFHLLNSWLKGELSPAEDELIPKIDRLVIVGPSIDSKQSESEVQAAVRTLTLSKQEQKLSTTAMTALDNMLEKCTKEVHIDLTSGSGDPCSTMWPQPPIHRVCFPKTGNTTKKLNLVTNPYQFELNSVSILTTDGKNVTDLMRSTPGWSGCDALERIVKWQHVAPTCPDTLDGFPFSGRDPLILNKTPHVLIAGNQDRPEVRRIKLEESGGEVLTICLPKFSETQAMCLLNLEDFNVSWRTFENN